MGNRPVVAQPGQYGAQFTQPDAVQVQPSAQNWMPAPLLAPPNCPPGLEYLTLMDQILVKQKVNVFELITGCDMKNNFKVQNSKGQQVYYVKEDVNCCTRQVCGPARPFDMKVTDNNEREVMHFYRPYRCSPWSWCGGCCQMEIEIESPPGKIIGFVKQDPTFCIPKFTVYGADKKTPMLKIVGPCCHIIWCTDVEFQVLDLSEKNKIGSVTKQWKWTGCFREAYTDADHFGITFPLDLDVKLKASLLGALMLIDFMYFESSQN